MPLFQLGQQKPQVHTSVFIAPGAVVVGKVTLHENSSVWFNSSLRGDNDLIELGLLKPGETFLQYHPER